jgi:HlyD family secretion protein
VKSRLRTFIAVSALSLGIVVTLRYVRDEPKGEWVTLERGELVKSIEVEGTLVATDASAFGPPVVRGLWDFKLSFLAEEGIDVRKGERIGAFDASQLQKQLEERGAELDSANKELEKKRNEIEKRQRDDAMRLTEAEARLDKARLKLERPAEFVARRETLELELDAELANEEVHYLSERRLSLDTSDRIALAMLEEKHQRASARVNELTQAISRMTLVAPRDGTVVHVANRRGEKKRVGDSVWQREKVVAVPDLDHMTARGYVDEAEAGAIEVGQPVKLRLDAYPEVSFSGAVRQISRTVQSRSRNSPVRVVFLEIELDETDSSRMRPDMRFRGEIEVDRISDALLLPVAAVGAAPEGPTVVVDTWKGAKSARVTLGRSNGRMVEVLRDLSEGDRVLLSERPNRSEGP